MSRRCCVLALALALGCTRARERTEPGETVVITEDGLSGLIPFDVPEGARSITVVVEGADAPIFALASFVLSDGVEHSTLGPPSSLTATHALGAIVGEGSDRQFPNQGTFTFQYPLVSSQALPPGPGTLRVASDVPGTRVSVRIVTPLTVGTTLHVSLVSFATAVPLDVEPALMTHVRAIYARAGVDIVVDELVALPSRAAVSLPAAPPSPRDAAGALVEEAHAALSTDALPIVFVELASGDGVSRGLPCPPDDESYYHGVLVDPTVAWPGDPDVTIARIVAHEIGHALGLMHLDDTLRDGRTVADPFDDTVEFDTTIMGSVDRGAPIPERALTFTEDQTFALRRSALFE